MSAEGLDTVQRHTNVENGYFGSVVSHTELIDHPITLAMKGYYLPLLSAKATKL